jgi:hypothetical protein
VFEELLLDADHFLNAANWMWLSATAFFNQVCVCVVSVCWCQARCPPPHA